MGTARLKRSSNVSEWTSLKPKTVAANLAFVGDSVKIFDLSEIADSTSSSFTFCAVATSIRFAV
jgi:hypothetical protein